MGEEPTRTTRQRTPTFQRPMSQARASLVLLAGPQPGRRYPVGDGIVLGRAQDASVELDDPEVSRRHLAIRRVPSGHVIEDLGSRNGTFLNGLPLSAPQAISVGDKIQIGPRVVLLFTQHDGVEDDLLRRQRLEALGRLGAGIAHDFNNMLAAVVSTLDYLRALPGSASLGDPSVRECIDDVHTAIARAAELTPRLLAFAGAGTGTQADVDISMLCTEVAQLVQRTFDRSTRIETITMPRLVVRGDRVALHQALMNLCINARDAMPEGGLITVRARMAAGEEVGTERPQVVLSVTDTGVGMDAATRKRIFEAFFTTKGARGGTGLGLATLRDIVVAHGGTVHVASEVGRGATFTIQLPLSRASDPRRALPTARNGAAQIPAPAPGRLLLLADDEHTVRRSFARLLRAAGHEVIEAADGLEALQRYALAPRRPDLVLLDLDMPRMAGDEAARRLRIADPLVRIVFVSGHHNDDVIMRLRAEGALAFVPKPVSAAAFLDAVARALPPQQG